MHAESAPVWMAHFLAAREARGLARPTVEQDRVVVGRLVSWMAARSLELTDLTAARLERYVAHLRQQRRERGARRSQLFAPATLSSWLSSIRSWLRHLLDHGVLLVAPLKTIAVKVPFSLCGRGVFTHVQITALFAALDGDDPMDHRERALFAVLYGAGLRIGEALALDLMDYNPDDRLISIRRGKAGSNRIVPIGPAAASDLDAYLAHARPVLAGPSAGSALFVTARGRLSSSRVRVRLHQIQARARIAPARGAHALRHAFATHLLAAGAEVRSVQRFLGHVDLATTAIYTHVDVADLKGALARAHPRERRRR